MPDKLTIDQFAQKIKDKYPEYKDLDNTDLTNKMIAKYPEYKEHVDYDVKKKVSTEPSQTPAKHFWEDQPEKEPIGSKLVGLGNISKSPKTVGQLANELGVDPKEMGYIGSNFERNLTPEEEANYIGIAKHKAKTKAKSEADIDANTPTSYPQLGTKPEDHYLNLLLSGADQGLGYLAGVTKNINKGTIATLRSINGAERIVSDVIKKATFGKVDAGDGVLGNVADKMEKHIQKHEELPDDVISQSIGQIAQLPTGFAPSLLLAPELKIAQMSAATGGLINGVPKLVSGLGLQNAFSTYEQLDKQGVSDGKKVVETLKSLGKGAEEGMYLQMFGYLSSATGSIVKGLTDKELAGTIASVTTNASLFGAKTAMDGGTAKDAVVSSIVGGLLGTPEVSKVIGTDLAQATKEANAKAFDRFNTTSVEDITKINAIPAKVSDLREQQLDLLKKAEKAEGEEKEHLQNAANVIDGIIDIKAVTNQILPNSKEFIDKVNEDPTLDDATKQYHVDKINEVVAKNDPRIQAAEPFVKEIESTNKEVETVSNNKSIPDGNKALILQSLEERKNKLIKDFKAETSKPLNQYELDKIQNDKVKENEELSKQAEQPKTGETGSETKEATKDETEEVIKEFTPEEEPEKYVVKASDLIVEPEKFQYKPESDKKTGKTKGVEPSLPSKKNPVTVWNDPKTGKDVVVEGHNKLEYAKEKGVEDIPIQRIEAKDENEALAKAALTNISKGEMQGISKTKSGYKINKTGLEFDKNGNVISSKVEKTESNIKKEIAKEKEKKSEAVLKEQKQQLLNDLKIAEDIIEGDDISKLSDEKKSQLEKQGIKVDNGLVIDVYRDGTISVGDIATAKSLIEKQWSKKPNQKNYFDNISESKRKTNYQQKAELYKDVKESESNVELAQKNYDQAKEKGTEGLKKLMKERLDEAKLIHEEAKKIDYPRKQRVEKMNNDEEFNELYNRYFTYSADNYVNKEDLYNLIEQNRPKELTFDNVEPLILKQQLKSEEKTYNEKVTELKNIINDSELELRQKYGRQDGNGLRKPKNNNEEWNIKNLQRKIFIAKKEFKYFTDYKNELSDKISREEELKESIKDRLGKIANIKNLTGEEKTDAIENIVGLIKDLGELGLIKIEQGFEKVWDYLKKEYEVDIPDDVKSEVESKLSPKKEEKLPKGEDEIGIKHASTDEMRKNLGIGEYERVSTNQEELKQRAKKEIEAGYNIEKLLSGLEDKSTYYGELEQAIVKEYISGLQKKITKNPTDELLSELSRAIKISDIEGSEAAKVLVGRKETFMPDDTLAGFFIREMENTGVDKLTDEQKAQVLKEFEEISSASDDFQSKYEKLQEEFAKLKSEIEFNKLKSQTDKSKKKDRESFITERQQIRKSIAEKWKLAGNDGTLSALPLPYAKQLAYITPDVIKLAKSYLEEGTLNLKDLVSKLHSDLKEDVSGITEADIHNILAGEYKEKRYTKNEKQSQLKDLREEARLINKLEKLESGIEPSEPKKKIERNKEITDLRNRIKEYRKSQSDILKEANKPEKEEKSLKSLKTRINNQISKIETELRTGDFAKDEKKVPLLENKEVQKKFPDLYKETLDAKDKQIKLKQEREIRLLKEKYANRKRYQKIGDMVVEVAGVPRTLMASMDFSAVFRQGLVPTISHPIIASKAIAEMFKQTFSEKRFQRWLNDIKESEDYYIMQESGLYVADNNNPKLTAKEEQFMNNISEKIPGLNIAIKGSERAYTSFLNKMRVDLFRTMTEAYANEGKTIGNSKKLYEATAKLINNMTGRGSVGKFEEAAKVLNTMFFSPRLIASRVNLLTNAVNPKFYADAPKEVRVQYFKDMAIFIAAGTAVLGMASMLGANVEKDPRSTDFGKIASGNLRYDIWGGFQQYVRLASQLLTGQRKSIKTKEISNLSGGYGKESRLGVLMNFVRGKLAPVPAIGADILSGRDYSGQPINVKDEVLKSIIPLWISDANQAMQDRGVASLFYVTVPNLLGVGTQTYTSDKKIEDSMSVDTFVKRHDPNKILNNNVIVEYTGLEKALNSANKKFNDIAKKYSEDKATEEYKKAGISKEVDFESNQSSKIDMFKLALSNYKDLSKEEQKQYKSAMESQMKNIVNAYKYDEDIEIYDEIKELIGIVESKKESISQKKKNILKDSE